MNKTGTEADSPGPMQADNSMLLKWRRVVGAALGSPGKEARAGHSWQQSSHGLLSGFRKARRTYNAICLGRKGHIRINESQ